MANNPNNITITYNLNDKDHTIVFDITQRASVLKYKICKVEMMQSESLEFYYKDQPISVNNDRPIKDIIGVDPKPKLLILAIGITPKQKRANDLAKEKNKSKKVNPNLEIDYHEVINTSNDNNISYNNDIVTERINKDESTKNKTNKSIDKLKNKSNIAKEKIVNTYHSRKKERPNRILEETIKKIEVKEPKVITTVLVEDFPSRQELFDLVEDFFEESNLIRDFKTNNRGQNSIEFLFKDIGVAYSFIKYFNIEKFNNLLYKKSKASILLETKIPNHKFSPKLVEHDNLRKNPVNNLNNFINLNNPANISNSINLADNPFLQIKFNNNKLKTKYYLYIQEKLKQEHIESDTKSLLTKLKEQENKENKENKDNLKQNKLDISLSNKSIKTLKVVPSNKTLKTVDNKALQESNINNISAGGTTLGEIKELNDKIHMVAKEFASDKDYRRILNTDNVNGFNNKVNNNTNNTTKNNMKISQTSKVVELSKFAKFRINNRNNHLNTINTNSSINIGESNNNNTLKNRYLEEDHIFINYDVPYLSQENAVNILDYQMKGHKPKYFNDNVDFIPFAAQRKMLEKNSLSKAFVYDNPYLNTDDNHIFRSDEKKMWLSKVDFIKMIKPRHKIY